jgi:hypothetical protein
MEDVLLEFAKEAKQQGVPMMILSVPAPQVVSRPAWESITRAYPAMRGVDWDLEAPERRLRAFATTHGIELIQPLRIFREAQDGPPLFFSHLGHMTARGHDVMAGALERPVVARLDRLSRK